MRIDLKVSYEEKDKAKALGARWDVARKTWYLIDPENLHPFKKWLNISEPKKVKKKKKIKNENVYKTGEYEHLCDCKIPPWEHCQHTIDIEESKLIKEMRLWI